MMSTRIILLAATILVAIGPARGQRADSSFLDLSGQWYFAIGDEPAWKMPGPDQSDWTTIDVPGTWESQGFPEYDGFAWYRRAFKLPPALQGADLVLRCGRIDDSDEVYVNGTFVGASGSMPPAYSSAYDAMRTYAIPSAVLNREGENIIAVRVFDERLDGGIVEGRVGIEAQAPLAGDLISLDGVWSFRTGDNRDWALPETDKEGWSNVTVPGTWEPQGFRDYDGYAWYRKEFFLPDQPEPSPFMLMMGKIDDIDQTFVNGVEVGHTGAIDRAEIANEDWRKEREYEVPAEVLRFGDYNVVAVRVYDGIAGGGLYEGPHALYPASMDKTTLQSRLENLLRRVTGG